MSDIGIHEIERQYRVLRQTLSIHAKLRDRYRFKANIVDGFLLIASVVFCATTFASDELYRKIGLASDDGKFILGVASIIAFCCSLLLLISNWREKSIQHRDAAQKWSEVLSQYRSKRTDAKQWPKDILSFFQIFIGKLIGIR
jgi:hypothetical protein